MSAEANEYPEDRPVRQSALVDHARLDTIRRLGLGPQSDMAARICALYLATAQSTLDQLSKMRAAETDEIALLLCSLKSMSSSTGAIAMARLCGTLEGFARNGDIAKVFASIDLLVGIFQRTRLELLACASQPAADPVTAQAG